MIATIGLLTWLVAAAGGSFEPGDDPLTRPIVTSNSAEWIEPRPPEKLFGNSYLVGFGGLSVALIDTGDGLILVDGALPQSASAILANVRTLGFRPEDIKYILSTEPHADHAGGIAALARDTGASVVASVRGAEALRSGGPAADDPQLAYDMRFPPVARVRTIADGETLRLGKTVVTAHATPGHTMGSMSWSWSACEAKRCRTIVFASSLNPVSADGYRYTAPASAPIVAGFAQSYRTMDALACDILIAAHPGNAGIEGARFNARPGACRAYADRSRRALAERIAEEKAATRP
ncbi:subclass B3 metallo-beta-lactamase [Sphingopyxis macrogoltabida]|uniref:Subclass B3 metallo-beta-lactamase n=1 Tax=Sphingopyxis macrogoltabida TaxID=33050 RepID=A0AAC9FEW4_SPHMC|nr:subclass B3 metallo-beta-lactamase [Sphingopyxis macrogoltabida]ALJ11422.1 beta-lactamase [Sphingopyxis macrogoltabida]AMU87616.1 subclass B3 metallo-beta-lactamase [Sphingopyxis macrogoltabida]